MAETTISVPQRAHPAKHALCLQLLAQLTGLVSLGAEPSTLVLDDRLVPVVVHQMPDFCLHDAFFAGGGDVVLDRRSGSLAVIGQQFLLADHDRAINCANLVLGPAKNLGNTQM